MLVLSGCATPRVAHDALPDRFSVSVGGAMGSTYAVELADGHLRYTASKGPHGAHQRTRRITPSAEQWAAFWHEAQAVDLWHWRRHYKVPPPLIVYDGTQWQIDIAHADQSVQSSGDNAYPADSTPTRTGSEAAERTQRFQRFTMAVQQLIGGRTFE